jgi:uncharacterized membrane protein YeaQ/YmgE (transglycosylase-associated protein family)
MGFGGVLGIVLTGFLIGAAARWIVPGPDPMPLWLTIGIGMSGSVVGGGIAAGLFGTSHITTSRGHIFTTLLIEVAVATAVVAAYRRFVQRRALTGPEAQRFPRRGVGIARMRARLAQVGIDPEQLRGRQPLEIPRPVEPRSDDHRSDSTARDDLPRGAEPTDELAELRDLHEKGILTDEEFEAARKRLYL